MKGDPLWTDVTELMQKGTASLASCLLIAAPESYRSGWNGFRGQGQSSSAR